MEALLSISPQPLVVHEVFRDCRTMVDGGTSPNRNAGIDGDVGANVDLALNIHRQSNPITLDSLAVLHLIPYISSDDGNVRADPGSWPDRDGCCVVDVAVVMDTNSVLDAKVVPIRCGERCFNLHRCGKLSLLCTWDNEVVRSVF